MTDLHHIMLARAAQDADFYRHEIKRAKAHARRLARPPTARQRAQHAAAIDRDARRLEAIVQPLTARERRALLSVHRVVNNARHRHRHGGTSDYVPSAIPLTPAQERNFPDRFRRRLVRMAAGPGRARDKYAAMRQLVIEHGGRKVGCILFSALFPVACELGADGWAR